MKKLTVNTLFRETFSMEERSNNIAHTNEENKDQKSNQNVRCNTCARLFRTNHGLLQHLNFCRRRNRHNGDNLNGNTQANNTTSTMVTSITIKSLKLAMQLILVGKIKMKIRSTSIGMNWNVAGT